MQTILKPLTNLFTMIFQAIHGFVSSLDFFGVGAGYVITIFLLTLLVRLILLPLNIKQTRSQQKMQEMQPEIAKLQKKYKNNPEKAQQEVMKLYKENNINPMSGCLPLVIQMPILFALYYVFTGLGELKGVSFLWMGDLWAPDKTFILPILSAATTFLSSFIMTRSTQSQSGGAAPGGLNMNTMNIVMAGMMGVMSIQFPSMLVLYWIIGNLIQMVQSYFLVVLPNKRRAREKEQSKDVK